MTSDPSLLMQKIRRLSKALLISGALNIGVLSLLLYWVLKERPPSPYYELKPATQEWQQVSSSDQKKWSEILTDLSQLSFPQLVSKLSNKQTIEDGYAERDLALAILGAFHHFDIHRGLPKDGQPQHQRYFSWKAKPDEPPIPLIIYSDLGDRQYEALIQFAKTERWPLTPEGLFLLLKEQKKEEENENLSETFFLTPPFWTVELIFNRSGQTLERKEILNLLLEGDWTLLKQFVDQQRQLQDTSDMRRQKLLTDYLKQGSHTAAALLIKYDWDFAVKKLDDQQVMTLLQAMPHQLHESEKYAKEMLASPRSAQVWRKASDWLYQKVGEIPPENGDPQTVLARFIPKKMELSSDTLVATQPKKVVSPPKITVEKTEKKPLLIPQPRTHSVQEGDSLWKIARHYGVKIDEIRKLNNLQSDTLKVGTILKIPTGKKS